MTTVTARVDGVDDFERRVESIVDRVLDLEPFWRDLGDWYDARQRRLFEPGGLTALKSQTIRRKGGNRAPLVRTGALRDAVLSGNPAKANAREAFYGIRKGDRLRPVAVFHREGARGKRRRNVVPPLNADDVDEIRDRLRKYVMREAG